MDDVDIGVPYLYDVQVSSTVLRRLQLIAPRTREWDNNPAAMSKEEREELAMMVASTFSRFEDFAIIGFFSSVSIWRRCLHQYIYHYHFYSNICSINKNLGLVSQPCTVSPAQSHSRQAKPS